METKERHVIYNDAYNLLEKGDRTFICCAISQAWMGHPYMKDEENILQVFPELAAQRPMAQFSAPNKIWFPVEDRKSRLDALNKCIELTRPSPDPQENPM